ncbi:MAG TPA: hypothetical protein VJN70_03495 [Gemmatimonadaceae bacterium]|nr:hypothetical protein [Gemmatimonadaceae bacterium]
MRKTILTLALVAAASPLGAQAAQAAKDNDPTHKVAGGINAAGWQGRIDPQAERRGMKLEDAKFASMGSGYHVTSGPAAIYWNPKDAAKGSYTVSASFTQTKAPMHPEAYGLFIGGSNLNDSTQSYVYFETRGDGKYLINHRAGNDVHKIVDWTETDATNKQDAAGKATNELAIRVSADSVDFLANGKVVKAFTKAEMHNFAADGQTGIRVNHNLDVHIDKFHVKSGK